MVTEDNNSVENEKIEDQQDLESAVAEEDDLEAQMAATMATESLTDSAEEDDLESQMTEAMAEELGGDLGEDDLEAQMAAAMSEEESTLEESTLEESLLDGLSEGLEDGGDSGVSIQPAEFQQLRPTDESGEKDNVNRLMDVSLILSVELGRKKMQIREILDLGPGKIIELDKLAGEPVDLLVSGKMLARGEVVVVDENFGVRITDLISPKDRIRSL